MTGWVRGVLGDERRFWGWAAGLLTAVSVLKGLRVPNDWAATEAQFGYGHGFVKRGLFGAVLTGPLGLEHYARFAAVSTVLLVGLAAGVVWFSRAAGVSRRFGSAVVGAVFGASYSVTYLAHLNGYLDISIALLAVGLLCVRRMRARWMLGVPVVAVAMLTHEMFLVVFLPVVLLSFLLQMEFEGEGRQRRAGWAAVACLAGVGIAMAALMGAQRPVSEAKANGMMQEIVAKADFAPRADFLPVLTNSPAEIARIMRMKQKTLRWWLGQVSAALKLLPAAGVLLYVTRRVLAESGRALPGWMFPACVVAALAPIAMGAIGIDTERWYGLAGLSTFLVLGCVCRYGPGGAVSLSPAVYRAAVIAIALGMASGGGLMDHSQILPFPFTSEGVFRAMHMQGPVTVVP